jgi:D-sedoheptulose 7-phosphate isomerase
MRGDRGRFSFSGIVVMDGSQTFARQDCATYISRLTAVLAAADTAAMDGGIQLIEQVWRAGGQIITLGNGGSAMTALHYVTDWNKSIFMSSGRSFRGRSLVDNMGLASAYANDCSYQDVFVEQLKNIAQPADLVVAISGSGNSENVIRAVSYANEIGCETLGLCGYSGGRLKEIARHVIWVGVDDMQLCEDVHALFGHMVMQALCGYGQTAQ